jgi:16S rRNA processing protein RimM
LSDKAERVLLGEIGAAQGLKGEVRLRSYTEDPAAIGSYGPFEDESGARVEIEWIRATPKGVVARISGVATREAADAMTGTRLYVPRARLPERGQDEWYHADLIGLAAQSKDGTPLGTVVAVVNFGAGDLIEVEPAGGGATLLVPFTEANVPEIDLIGRRLVVVPLAEVE